MNCCEELKLEHLGFLPRSSLLIRVLGCGVIRRYEYKYSKVYLWWSKYSSCNYLGRHLVESQRISPVQSQREERGRVSRPISF
jgi:hypothetical protein